MYCYVRVVEVHVIFTATFQVTGELCEMYIIVTADFYVRRRLHMMPNGMKKNKITDVIAKFYYILGPLRLHSISMALKSFLLSSSYYLYSAMEINQFY